MSRLLSLHAILVFLFASNIAFAADIKTLSNVNKDFFHWQKNTKYESTVSFKATFSDVRIIGGKIDDRNIKYSNGGLELDYEGTLKYYTETGENLSRDKGSVSRIYEEAFLSELMANGSIKTEVEKRTLWDIIRSPFTEKIDLGEDGTVIYKINIDKQKEIINNLDVISALRKEFKYLTGKEYKFTWDSPIDDKNAQLSIAPQNASDKEDGLGHVKDFVAQEICLFYNALLGNVDSKDKRKEGETWIIDANILNSFVNPSVKIKFEGFICVKAESLNNEHVPGHEKDLVYGLKIKLIPYSNLGKTSLFVRVTLKNGEIRTKEIEINHKNTGELWLDKKNQMIPYANLKISNLAGYGKIPDIGKFDAKEIECEGQSTIEFTYTQVKTENEKR